MEVIGQLSLSHYVKYVSLGVVSMKTILQRSVYIYIPYNNLWMRMVRPLLVQLQRSFMNCMLRLHPVNSTLMILRCKQTFFLICTFQNFICL